MLWQPAYVEVFRRRKVNGVCNMAGKWISMLCFVAMLWIVEACHVVGHEAESLASLSGLTGSEGPAASLGARRRRALAAQVSALATTESVIAFFPNCMMSLTDDATTDYDSVVKFFVEYTAWFGKSNDQCTGDTVECWNVRLEEILREGSLQLSAAKECTKKYFFYNLYSLSNTRFEAITQDSQYTDGRDSSQCPTRTTSNYEQCIKDYIAKTNSTAFDFTNFNAVLNFVDQKAKCDSCSCTAAIDADQDFGDYFRNNNLMCNSCWSTRFAGLVTDDQAMLKEATAACSATLTDTVFYVATGNNLRFNTIDVLTVNFKR